MSTFWIVVLCVLGVLLIIGIIRVMFDGKTRSSIFDVLIDLMMLDFLFDLLGAIGEGLGSLGDSFGDW